MVTGKNKISNPLSYNAITFVFSGQCHKIFDQLIKRKLFSIKDSNSQNKRVKIRRGFSACT
jgi:hypothetical protein